MNRHFLPSDEATWTGADRFWTSVQQYPPRRRLGTIRGHVLAALLGGSLATALLLIEAVTR